MSFPHLDSFSVLSTEQILSTVTHDQRSLTVWHHLLHQLRPLLTASSLALPPLWAASHDVGCSLPPLFLSVSAFHHIKILLWLYFLIFKNLLYWSVIDLQWCVNFCCTVKWFNHVYIHMIEYIYRLNIYIYNSFLCSFPQWLVTGYWVQSPVLCSGAVCFCILYIIVCICWPHIPVHTPPSFLLGNHKSALCVREFVSVS